MCVSVSRPTTIVTFLRKNGDPAKRVVDFPRERDTFRNKIMEIVEDFDEKSDNNNNGKPWKSSRILRVNPIFHFFFFFSSFFHFLSFSFIFLHFFHLFLFFHFFKKNFLFFIFSKKFFFIFFIFSIFLIFSFFFNFHFLSFSFIQRRTLRRRGLQKMLH